MAVEFEIVEDMSGQIQPVKRGRGRPRKNVAPVNPEESETKDNHIIVNLRKAVSLHGRHDVPFQDGSTSRVHPTLAARIIQKYNSMRPHEKEELQKKISKSVGHLEAEDN